MELEPFATARNMLAYNNVRLEILQTLNYERVLHTDSQDKYLWTIVKLSVQALYNPANGATTYSLKEGQPHRPVYTVGQSAPETEEAVRHALLQPRKRLIYRKGGVALIDTPLVNGMYLDANNGPRPTNVRVTKIHGEKTFNVAFEIETFISEANLYGTTGVAPLIVSNQWEMRESIEPIHYAVTRRTTGRMICRTDRLREVGRVVDEFRANIIHPCPPGFKREDIDIAATEEGNELHWTVVDVEQHQTLVRGLGVTKIDADHTIKAQNQSLLQTGGDLLATGGNIVSSLLDFGQGQQRGGRGRAIARRATQAINIGSQVAGFVGRSFPGTGHHFNVKVWGELGVQTAVLSNVAWRVLNNRLAATGIAGGVSQSILYAVDVAETHVVTAPYVELMVVLQGGLPRLDFVFTGISIPNTSAMFPAEDSLGADIATIGNAGQNFTAPPNSNGTRGRYLGGVLAQVLQEPTVVQTRPTNRTISDQPLA